MTKHHPAGIVASSTPWQDIILVCRKCSKKCDGGFGPSGDQSLTRELKTALRGAGRRRTTRIVETKCLGLCPKGAVTVLPASQPGQVLAIPAGTPAATILATLPQPPAPHPRHTAAPAAAP